MIGLSHVLRRDGAELKFRINVKRATSISCDGQRVGLQLIQVEYLYRCLRKCSRVLLNLLFAVRTTRTD